MELTRFTAVARSPRGTIVRLEGLHVDCEVIKRIGDLIAEALTREPVEAVLVDTTNMLGYGDNCECGTLVVVLARRLMELNRGIRFAVVLPERAQRKIRSMRMDGFAAMFETVEDAAVGFHVWPELYDPARGGGG